MLIVPSVRPGFLASFVEPRCGLRTAATVSCDRNARRPSAPDASAWCTELAVDAPNDYRVAVPNDSRLSRVIDQTLPFGVVSFLISLSSSLALPPTNVFSRAVESTETTNVNYDDYTHSHEIVRTERFDR